MPPLANTPAGYVVVTGAAAGIGLAIGRRLAQQGWRVAAVDRDQPALDACDWADARFAVDVAEADQWDELQRSLRSQWPRLDLLVNNAGVLMGGELVDSPPAELMRVIDVNLKGVMLGCRALAPWLIASRQQRPAGQRPLPGVINLSSVFAALAPPGFAAYSASKAGVLALSESLRGELAPHGLNVTVAAPGVVRTELFRKSWFANDAYRRASDRFLEDAQLDAADVAHAVLRAASVGRLYAVIGARAKRMWWLKRMLPGFLSSRIARRAEAELRRLPPTADPDRSVAGRVA